MPPFEFSVRVYYEDTDAEGVVYYANYLKFLERARSEWLRDQGFPVSDLATAQNLIFVVTRVAIDYLAPARLDELLSVTVAVNRVSRAGFVLDQSIIRDDKLLSSAVLTLACLDATTFKPVRIPGQINRMLNNQL